MSRGASQDVETKKSYVPFGKEPRGAAAAQFGGGPGAGTRVGGHDGGRGHASRECKMTGRRVVGVDGGVAGRGRARAPL